MAQQQTIGILGLGVFGMSVAFELSQYDVDVIAVDSNPEHVQEVSDYITNSVVGDVNDLELLEMIGLDQCDLVLIGIGSNLASSVLALMNCKKLKIPRIIAKAKSRTYEEILLELGADQVILPEQDSGIRVASKIMRSNIEEILRLDDHTSLLEFRCPQEWVGKSILELDLRNTYDLNLIGTREEPGEILNSRFDIYEPLEKDVFMVAVASSHTFERHDYLNHFT